MKSLQEQKEELEEIKEVLDEENLNLNNRINILIQELEQSHGAVEMSVARRLTVITANTGCKSGRRQTIANTNSKSNPHNDTNQSYMNSLNQFENV